MRAPLQRCARPVLLSAALGGSMTTAQAADWTEHLRLESDDGAHSLRIGGRLHGDIAAIDSEGEHDTVEEWRRARLSLSGRIANDWRFRYEHDFAADPDNEIKDAWIGYYGWTGAALRAGNLQEPVSIDELSSSNATTFMERALPNALVPGYHLGVMGNLWGERWNAAFGFFEGDIQGRDDAVDPGWGVALRGVKIHDLADGGLLHGGISLAYRRPPSDHRLSLSARPEVHLADHSLIATGRLSDVDYTLTSGLELVALDGPWSVQAEYLRTDVERDGRPALTFDGWYLQGSWFVGQGRRAYDRRDGTFDAVRPGGDLGALEFAVRYSVLDLEDGPITGGTERNWTLGLNWYLSEHLRLMLNRVWARADPNRNGTLERLDATQARLQYVF